MIFKARHVVGLLMVLVLVSGCSLFGKKEVVPQVPEVLKITAPANVYAHIYRPFPDIENEEDVDEIVVEGRFRPGASAGSSWIAQLAVYWEPNQLLSIGAESSGHVRTTGVGVSGVSARALNAVESGMTWRDLRIRLTESRIEMLARGDGDWILISEADRPASMAGLPAEIIVGKGFQGGSPPYIEPHLDNSIADDETGPGEVGVNYIDDVAVLVNGNTLFHEEFNELEGWEMHIDPEYADQISIDVAPMP